MRGKVLPACLLVLASTPTAVWSHGESEPGPHGGEIRMPGAFHVEAVAADNAVLLYLLNMAFEQPRVDGSSVTATHIHEGEARELDCHKAADEPAFRCTLPAEAALNEGELVVDATRGGKPAEPARYELPLAWSEREAAD